MVDPYRHQITRIIAVHKRLLSKKLAVECIGTFGCIRYTGGTDNWGGGWSVRKNTTREKYTFVLTPKQLDLLLSGCPLELPELHPFFGEALQAGLLKLLPHR